MNVIVKKYLNKIIMHQEIIEYIRKNPDKKITVCRHSIYHEVSDVSISWDCIVLHYSS